MKTMNNELERYREETLEAIELFLKEHPEMRPVYESTMDKNNEEK